MAIPGCDNIPTLGSDMAMLGSEMATLISDMSGSDVPISVSDMVMSGSPMPMTTNDTNQTDHIWIWLAISGRDMVMPGYTIDISI